MTTWRADVFPDSSVGEISVEVEVQHFMEQKNKFVQSMVMFNTSAIFVRLVCFLVVLGPPVVLDGEQSLFSLVYFYSSHIGSWFLLIGIIWFIWNIFK